MMKRIVIALCSLFFSSSVFSQEWMSTRAISFYETQAEKFTLTETTSTLGLDLSDESLEDPFIEKASRPYGFGRELDDQSPADFAGLRKDTAYFLGYQFFIVAALYYLPESVSAWTDGQKEKYDFEKWRYNVKHPHWDGDQFYINYILHPYWGMTYYTRGRERGLTETGAFWYSFGLSTLYEFGLEALFEPVSIQDVFVTPGVGSLMGYYVEGVRREIKSQRDFSVWDKTILIATDPIGSLNTIVEGMFSSGVDSKLELQTFYRSPALTSFDQRRWEGDPYASRLNPIVMDYVGLELTLQWH
jgi:hypothetical protein